MAVLIKMTKLIYTIDFDYDWGMINHLEKTQGRNFGVGGRVKYKNAYKRADKALKKSKQLYQKSWDEIGDYFFKRVAEITKHKWKFKKYECVVSLVHKGVSNWGGNKIIRIWAENPYFQRKITGHELIISHLWNYLDENGYADLPDVKKWAFCEISAWAITGLDKKMVEKCWPWIFGNMIWPLKHNYPHLVKTQVKARPLFEKRTTFKQYTDRLVDILVKDKGINHI